MTQLDMPNRQTTPMQHTRVLGSSFWCLDKEGKRPQSPDSSTPGAWTCTDMKGVSYFLVPVDEKGSLAFFSGFEVKDSQNAGCYCSKLC